LIKGTNTSGDYSKCVWLKKKERKKERKKESAPAMEDHE